MTPRSVYIGELARSVRRRALHRLGLAQIVDSSSSTGDKGQAGGRVAWMVKGEQQHYFLRDEVLSSPLNMLFAPRIRFRKTITCLYRASVFGCCFVPAHP